MKSVIVIMLITVVVSLLNARPPFKRVSVGGDDFETLCLRKTSCHFLRLFLRGLNSTAQGVELSV